MLLSRGELGRARPAWEECRYEGRDGLASSLLLFYRFFTA